MCTFVIHSTPTAANFPVQTVELLRFQSLPNSQMLLQILYAPFCNPHWYFWNLWVPLRLMATLQLGNGNACMLSKHAPNCAECPYPSWLSHPLRLSEVLGLTTARGGHNPDQRGSADFRYQPFTAHQMRGRPQG